MSHPTKILAKYKRDPEAKHWIVTKFLDNEAVGEQIVRTRKEAREVARAIYATFTQESATKEGNWANDDAQAT